MKLGKTVDQFLENYGVSFSVEGEERGGFCCVFSKSSASADFLEPQLNRFGSSINGNFILIFSSLFVGELIGKIICVKDKKYFVKCTDEFLLSDEVVYRFGILNAV